MTHDELVERAATWLRKTKKCSVVLTELTGGYNEIADVIGWYWAYSILIEAKTSMSDFRTDKKKRFRQTPKTGMGCERYYIVPEDMAESVIAELPDGWGLLVCRGKEIIVECGFEGYYASHENHNVLAEVAVLLSIIKRIAGSRKPFDGVNINCYKYESSKNPRATLHVDLDEANEKPLLEWDDILRLR